MKNIVLTYFSNPNRILYTAAFVIGAGLLFVSEVIGIKLSLIMCLICLGFAVLLYISFEKELMGLWLIFILLYLITSQPTDPLLRRTGGSFTLFSRFSLYFSPWDYLLFLLLGVWFYKNTLMRKIRIRWIEYPEIKLYCILMLFAFFTGILHISGSYLSYGQTRLLHPLIAFMPFYYFVIIYLMTINFIKTGKDVDNSLRFLWLMNFVLIIFAIIRLILILQGSIRTIWGFGLPVIIYKQAFFMMYPVFLYGAFKLLRIRHRYRNIFVTFILLLLILITTRRFMYLSLIFGMLTVFFYTWTAGKIKFPRVLGSFVKIATIIFCLGIIIFMIFPAYVSGIIDSAKSIYFLSEHGLSYGGDTRKAEIENIFLNMKHRKYSYLTGFGLGTMWKTETFVPFDAMAYSEKELQNSKGWYSKFHLPYISKIYRFGFIGTFLFIVILFYFVRRSIYFIRKANGKPYYQAQLIALSALLTVYMFESGDSIDSTTLIYCGFLYGLQTSIYRIHIRQNDNN